MKNLTFALFLLLFGPSMWAQRVSTPEDRAALFDYIYEKTLEREAWSPIKEEVLNYDPRAAMRALKEEVVNADNDVDLYYALQKLSASRRDRHLSIDLIDGGLVLPEIEEGQAPINFHPDFANPDDYFMFVADLGKDLATYVAGDQPEIGDKLLKVNGEDFDAYFERVRLYTRYSNRENLWRRVADDISSKDRGLPPSFFQEQLTLTLERKNGTVYEIALPYLKEVDWTYGRVFNDYPGFKLVPTFQYESFQLYEPTDPRNKTLLLWWYGFRGDLPDASDALVEWAEAKGMLDHDLIIDAIDGRGGSQGAYALARLTSEPFKTTGGNLKLSDITDDFIAGYTSRYVARKDAMDGEGREAQDDGTWVMEWLHGPVMKGLAAGQSYSNDVPFKCAHLPYYSDWIMQPAEKHFTGKMAVLFGPWGGSHLSQFSAMINDNELGYTLGMPAGGYSNTWEWHEELVFPISGQPVVEFMWNIGHTIRPNGQILEGNAVPVKEFIPVTRDNYLTYKQMLIEKATDWLKSDEIDLSGRR